jgi:hypothetical protein
VPGSPAWSVRRALLAGLLWLAVAGGGHAAVVRRVLATATERELVVSAAGLLLTAIMIGLAAQAVGLAVAELWLGRLGRLSRPLAARRLRRWRAADQAAVAAEEADDGAAFLAATTRRNRICLAEPRRATWMGDRVAALESRVLDGYGLDLASAWPRLWLLLSDSDRDEHRRARDAWQQAGTLSAWGVLCLPLAGWWPAGVVAVAAIAVGWRWGRVAVSALATLAEAQVDVRGADLIAAGGPIAPPDGRLVTARFRKGT